ncbi:membrane protein [Mycobacterium sp. ST-F2]|uniref:DoxX family protein n=1 Tax=Mycobacterium sp. ST-F2 TaxID=1490484 RepID=UPI000938EA7F|nr:DoxX family protein [Mycobacterium sp. ST-F2]OKH80045.1 membrane protein [Mycobacterium sp. ST-F2]
MTSDTAIRTRRNPVWIGRVMSGLAIGFLLVDASMKLVAPAVVTDAGAQLGFPGTATARQLGVILLICTIVHVIPRTSVLGAILLTGYLGGTVATQMRVHAPVFGSVLFGVYLGVLIWGGLWFRDNRIRSLIPLAADR